MVYFNGFVQGDDPFCLFLPPHQPHFTPFEFAPGAYYERLPEQLELPANVPAEQMSASLTMYRHYLAMILAIDDMVGNLDAYLRRTSRSETTIVVLTSDHGTQAGAHGVRPWLKKYPYEESIRIPAVIRFPGVIKAGSQSDALTAMPDFFPTLCSLAGIPVPRSAEAYDLSDAWQNKPGAFEQDAVLTMNFSQGFDWIVNGMEWRGLRSKDHCFACWLNGKVELFDLHNDPLQMNKLADGAEHAELRARLEARMAALQARRGDSLVACTDWKNWLDNQRRVVRNAYGELGDPEKMPDWSLLY